MKELDYWRCSESLPIEPTLHQHQLYSLRQHAKVAELGAETIVRPLGARLQSKRSTWTLRHLKDLFNFSMHDASSVLAAWSCLAQDLDSIANCNWIRTSTSKPQIVPLAWSLVSAALATGAFNQLNWLPRGFVAQMEALQVLQGILRCAHKHLSVTNINKPTVEGNSTASQFTQDQVRDAMAGCCT